MTRRGSTLRFGLVVTSDRVSRGLARDEITPLARKLIEDEGHVLVYSVVVPNSVGLIRRAVLDAVSWSDVVLVTGGTGPGPRDLSIEAVGLVARKEVPGLGLFMAEESRASVGDRALMSRSTGFVVGDSLVMVSPGALDAVEKALGILFKMAPHAVRAIRGASKWVHGCA